METGISIIRSMPETRDVHIENHTATVELAADDQQVAALLEKLTALGRAHYLLRRQRTLAGRRFYDGHKGGGSINSFSREPAASATRYKGK